MPANPKLPTVFVVDDDLHMRQSLSALLEALQFNVCAFSSAKASITSTVGICPVFSCSICKCLCKMACNFTKHCSKKVNDCRLFLSRPMPM